MTEPTIAEIVRLQDIVKDDNLTGREMMDKIKSTGLETAFEWYQHHHHGNCVSVPRSWLEQDGSHLRTWQKGTINCIIM